jgi:hypothetical protein
MFSLYIAATEDGWIDIIHALENVGQGFAAYLYFSSYIILAIFFATKMIVAIVVTNLVSLIIN